MVTWTWVPCRATVLDPFRQQWPMASVVPVLLLLPPSDPSATSLPHRTPPTIVLRSSRRRRPMFDVVDHIFAVEAFDGPYADVESVVLFLVAVAVAVVDVDVEALLVGVVAVVIDVAVVFGGLRVVFREVHLLGDDRRRRRHRSMIPSSYQQ
jgi:hypothetical protein